PQDFECRRVRTTAGSPQTDQAPRARSRGHAPCRRLPLPGRQPKMMYPLILDLAADGVPITVTCRVLGFSTQAFYKWKKDPVTQRDWDDAHLINAAREIHADDPAFGYRFIADELPDHGIIAGENRVARLCSQERIWSVFAKRKGLGRKAGPPVYDDLVDRQFAADRPNQVWLTDITEHRTDEGKLYLCAIKDVYSNRIVGYSIS